MALRLTRVTGFLVSWLLIASALMLMALRRSITFYQNVVNDISQPINIPAEITALTISVLMLIGIYLIRPYFAEHRETLKTLEISRALYRDILENMTDTFYRTDIKGRLTILSSSVFDLLGYTPNELTGVQLSKLFANPADLENILTELRSTGYVTGYESLLERKDGSHVLVEANSRLVTDNGGNEIAIEGVARNIDARKRAEQLSTRLGRIVEESTNEIFVFDSETLKFIQVNNGARENLGYTLDEVRELTPVCIKPEFDEARFRKFIQPLRDGSSTSLQFETLHQRKDGSTYPVDIRLQLARSEDPPVFFAIIQDISERKRTERELLQSQKLRAVGQLTGGIAHDFNNLLTVIQGNIELALDEIEVSGSVHECLDASLDAARKSASLTQRLLAFSRKQPLKPDIIDLGKLVESIGPLIRQSLPEDVDIQFNCEADTWPCEVDTGQLETMLLNLSINAGDAMDNGGTMELSAANVNIDEDFVLNHPEATPGQYVLLSVRDSGHGMTPDVLEKVFEPFFTTKKEGHGTGLGLSMVYGFVRQSGGIVDIDSDVDNGTTVRVYLPAVPGATTRPRDTRKHANVQLGQGKCILVVEDDENLLSLTARLLHQLQYEALLAPNADVAIKILQGRSDIDVMLTDVVLEGSMNGVELAEVIERRWPSIKVAYMSGYSESAITRKGRLKPGVILLRKPFTKTQLAQVISEASGPGD